MKNFEITLYCCFCPEKITRIIGSEGWWIYANCIDEEAALCPHHSIIKKWIDACCSGCAGGWGECSLWQSFAWKKKTITDEQLETIAKGVCPVRVNGTIITNRTKDGITIEDVDVSEHAPEDASQALVDAIKEYRQRYCKEEKDGLE